METNWYVVKVLPGKERSLTEQFNKEISLGKIKNITRFICPTEKEFIVVRKKKVLREKVLYSGYLYFESDKKLSNDELKVIASIQNIMGMMGDKTPLLLKETDVRRILKDEVLDDHIESKKLKFTAGDKVIVTEGPFQTFNGVVSEIKGDKVDVEVKIFGRNTLVSLTFEQIEKS
jgi:transcriptional antiterminator NusG